LVVDDEAPIRDCLRLILEDTYDVVEASSGAVALEILASVMVDLVVLDLLMPGADGIQILPMIRARHPDLPVIVLTAVKVEWLTAEALRFGAHAYITKPFDERSLVEAVGAAISGKRTPLWGNCRPTVPVQPLSVLVVSADSARGSGLALVLKTLGPTAAVAALSDVVSRLLDHRPACMVVCRSGADAERMAALLTVVRDRLPECRVVTASSEAGHVKGIVDGVAHALEAKTTFGVAAGRAVEHIINHYRGRLTVPDVAEGAGISASHLAHLFPAQVGMTLHTFVFKLRVEIAKRLLSTTNDKLAVIAELAGFSDASHLSRAVQRETGLSARDHRRPWAGSGD
jgi:CheY-like chemotaxis protein/AraC-like DNA-binding protein